MSMLKKRTAVLVMMFALSTAVLELLNATPSRCAVLTSQSDGTGSAYSVGGKVSVELREVRYTQVFPGGKAMPLRVFLLFEPRSGAFSWIVTDDLSNSDGDIQTNLFKNYRAVFLRDGSLITFTPQMAPLMLRVQESRDHASSMDEAQNQALGFVSGLKDPPRDVELARPVHTIRLDRLIPDLVSDPASQSFGPDPKVGEVRWNGQQWTVILKSRWTEAITLDTQYKVVSLKPLD
ncbi:MAG: hypothetical protein ABSB60_15455 [Terracidiphilus sp.]|jgi:hypothetical protein